VNDANSVCVGTENNLPYCYGDKSECLWDTVDCTDNTTCSKYKIMIGDETAAKYTDGNTHNCDVVPSDHWGHTACKK
jgi:hypothetical protein